MPAWLLALLIKVAISFLEAKATSIAKADAPAVVSRLQNVASNVKEFHGVNDFPAQVKSGGV
jgi:hypothetical protein